MAASMARPAASLLLLMATSATAFAPSLPTSRPAVLGRSAAASLLLSAPRRAVADGAVGAKMAGNEGGDVSSVSRRGAMGVLFGLGLTFAGAGSAEAKDKEAINDCAKWSPGRIWVTGKSCQTKGPDKEFKDKTGTKKDPKYLRKLQDCRAACQAPVGNGEKELTKDDCLKRCRDEVCTTYEQCTYQIGPKEDYGGFFF